MEILETSAAFIIPFFIAAAILYGLGKSIKTLAVEPEQNRHKYRIELEVILKGASPARITLYSDTKHKTASDIIENCGCIKMDKTGLHFHDYAHNTLRYFSSGAIAELRVETSECKSKETEQNGRLANKEKRTKKNLCSRTVDGKIHLKKTKKTETEQQKGWKENGTGKEGNNKGSNRGRR